MLLKKEQKNGKKYLNIFGIRIPYDTHRTDYECTAFIGCFKIPYWHDSANDSLYLNLFGKRLYIKQSRKLNHYRLRETLSKEKCQALLEDELTPLLGYKPNLISPKTFNEKINWLKLNYHNPLITTCCDKYAIKEYAAPIIGNEYILPVLGAWKHANEIDFEALPNQFALKVNWSSGFNIIVKDKSTINIEEIVEKLNNWMSPCANSYYDMFNWGYKDMNPIIYAEPYIEQIDGQVYDYKFYFSNGEFIYMFISTDRLGEDKSLTYTFFDKDFNYMPFVYGNKPNAVPIPQMPINLHKMLEKGKLLAKDFPFVRVDFYELNEDEIYLGEMTFYSGGGTLPFYPPEWDEKLGEKIVLDDVINL